MSWDSGVFFHQIDFSSKTAFLWLGGLSPTPQPANKFKPSTGLVAKYIQCSQTENLLCKEWEANRIWKKCDFCLRPWNGFWGWLLQRVCGIHMPGFRNQSYQLSWCFCWPQNITRMDGLRIVNEAFSWFLRQMKSGQTVSQVSIISSFFYEEQFGCQYIAGPILCVPVIPRF